MSFINIDPKELDLNFFKAIDKQWMLITAGDKSGLNTMTASWGGTGVICLLPVFDEAAPYFEQAELVLVCKKLYRSKMSKEGFVDPSYADKFYSDNDWHYAYIGEIVKVLKKPD